MAHDMQALFASALFAEWVYNDAEKDWTERYSIEEEKQERVSSYVG
jgi:hypothetical protein